MSIIKFFQQASCPKQSIKAQGSKQASEEKKKAKGLSFAKHIDINWIERAISHMAHEVSQRNCYRNYYLETGAVFSASQSASLALSRGAIVS